jgi:Major Facilitator Superfamily
VNIAPILVTLYLIRHMSAEHDQPRGGSVDVVGAVLCALGLGGTVFALIEQPNYSWGDPIIAGPLVGGLVLLIAFVFYERQAKDPMLSLDLFKRRNFSVGNASTLLVYGGLSGATFLIPIFLQEVANYSPLGAGAALLPVTVCMFLLSPRFGALADRYGPRAFMGGGPIIAGLGLLLLSNMDSHVDFATEILPGSLVFGVGLAMTVAPLTATVLGGVDEQHASLASGVNNAIARVAGLVAIAFVGAIVSAAFSSTLDSKLDGRVANPRVRAVVHDAKSRALAANAPASLGPQRPFVQAAITSASQDGYRAGMIVMSVLVVLGGVISAVGIANPQRDVKCAECPGGALAGATLDAGRAEGRRELPRVRLPQRAGAEAPT